MANSISKEAIKPIIEYLGHETRDRIKPTEVMALSRLMANAIHDEVARHSEDLHNHFRAIVDHIDVMKEEVSRLQASEVTNNRIPTAGTELQSVVKATEDATHTIMEAAEAIMSDAPQDPDAYRTFVDEKMVSIFEACSFQDLSGQRITKVVDTLTFIETRLRRFADHFGVQDAEGHATDEEKAKAKRKEDLILNGPEDDGVSQDDIDALFG